MHPKRRPRLGKLKLYSNRLRSKHRSRSSPRQIATLRLHDLARLFRARHGITLPNTDTGREAMAIALSHLASLKDPVKRMDDWLGLWCPWLMLKERTEIIGEALIYPQRWTADELAWRLRLIYADRQTLAITTIGAIDCPKRERIKRRKAKIARTQVMETKEEIREYSISTYIGVFGNL